eukprot:120028_1
MPFIICASNYKSICFFFVFIDLNYLIQFIIPFLRIDKFKCVVHVNSVFVYLCDLVHSFLLCVGHIVPFCFCGLVCSCAFVFFFCMCVLCTFVLETFKLNNCKQDK